MTQQESRDDIVLERVQHDRRGLIAGPHQIGIIVADGKVSAVFSEGRREVPTGVFRRPDVQTFLAYTRPFRLEFWLNDPGDSSMPDEGIVLDRPIITADGQLVTGWVDITFWVRHDGCVDTLRLLDGNGAVTKRHVAREVQGEVLAKVLAVDLRKHDMSDLRGNEDVLRGIYASLERELKSTLDSYGLSLTNLSLLWGLSVDEQDALRKKRRVLPSPSNGGKSVPHQSNSVTTDSQGTENGVIVFKNDDAGYRNWLRVQPGGYVLNANSDMRTTSDMRLHRATCWTLEPTRYRTLTVSWYKVCATSKAAIEVWVRQQYNGFVPVPCGTCHP